MTNSPRKSGIVGAAVASVAMCTLLVLGRFLPNDSVVWTSRKIVEVWAYPLMCLWNLIPLGFGSDFVMQVAFWLSCLAYAAVTGLLVGWILGRFVLSAHEEKA